MADSRVDFSVNAALNDEDRWVRKYAAASLREIKKTRQWRQRKTHAGWNDSVLSIGISEPWDPPPGLRMLDLDWWHYDFLRRFAIVPNTLAM